MCDVMCSTTLFTVGAFPMVFVLDESTENKIVTQVIQHGGGCISSTRGPYGICLSSPKNSQSLSNEVVFSTEFIKDCSMANRILDINQYRLSGSSSCPDNFDVMKVLLRQSHWPASAERDESESANIDRHSDSDTTMESQNSRTNINSSRRTFSANQEKEILRYIVENKEIGLISGNTLWKKIAQRKIQGRTWQSLKKHFLKHMLPNITKYTFLSETHRIEFQKQGKTIAESHDVTNSEMNQKSSSPIPERLRVHESSDIESSCCRANTDDQRLQDISQFNRSTRGKTIAESHDVTNSEMNQKSSSPIRERLRLHKTAASGDAGSSSSQSHVERSNSLPSPSESSVSNDSRNLKRDCDRRLPEKRKPFSMSRVHESSDIDSSCCRANTDDQRLQDISQFNRSTSSQVHHQNKDGRHPRKKDDLQHPEKSKACIVQRAQSVINSSEEVVSGSEEDHRAPVSKRTNEERRQQTINSSDEGDSGSEHRRAPIVQKANNERRKSRDTSSDEWFVATDRERHHGNLNTHPKPKKLRKRRREEFTMEEEYSILKYLQKHNRFNNTGGNNVWKNMAASQAVGNRHTWQSLRERYLKKIVPNINKYNLPEEIVKRVKRYK